jgi:uncharacterized UBP type Zn finger protein
MRLFRASVVYALNASAPQEIVTMLMSMGFSDHASGRAALGCGNKGVTEAQEWAFRHMDDPDFNLPVGDSAPAAAAAIASGRQAPVADESVVATLISMGFSDQA